MPKSTDDDDPYKGAEDIPMNTTDMSMDVLAFSQNDSDPHLGQVQEADHGRREKGDTSQDSESSDD